MLQMLMYEAVIYEAVIILNEHCEVLQHKNQNWTQWYAFCLLCFATQEVEPGACN